MRIRAPTAMERCGATVLAVLIFVLDYGLLFWAERRVPSGIAAVMLATIPVFMTLSEIWIIKTQRLTVRLGAALITGIAGVAVLVNRSGSFGATAIDTPGACALVVAAISWSLASAFARKVPLPPAVVPCA